MYTAHCMNTSKCEKSLIKIKSRIPYWLIILILVTFIPILPYILGDIQLRQDSQKIEIQPLNHFDTTIVVVADFDYDPFSFWDNEGNLSGFEIELLYLIANKMEVNVEINLIDWQSCNAAIRSGEADMILGLDYRRGGYEGLVLSRAIINDSFVCFGRDNFYNISELYDKKIAALHKSGCIPEFLEPYELMDNTIFFDTYTEVLSAVASGKADYAIARFSVGRRILAKLGETEVRAVGPVLTNNSKCFGLNENSAFLLPGLNWAISELTNDGTIEALYKKWLGRYVEIISFGDFIHVYRSYFYYIVYALFVLVAFSGYYLNRARLRTNQALQAEQLKEKEIELQESRVAIMLSQIQPHFLFNTLAAIKTLCNENPKLAEETVVEFSEYLRANLDSLSYTAPIPFERELQHVETYLSIEKKRFGEKLRVVFNISTKDFMIPALTLQPIVENAVQHGITRGGGAGVVTIQTGSTDTEILITVTDDGIGYDPEQPPPDDGRKHIGIENVRSRLASMCGGTLTIQSKHGEGTKAVITIRRE